MKAGDAVRWSTSTGTWTGTIRRIYGDGTAGVQCEGSIVTVSLARLEVDDEAR